MSVLEMLLNAKGDVAKGNLLHRPAGEEQGDSVSFIDLLLHLGADPNAHEYEDPAGYYMRYGLAHGTLLHTACYHSDREAVKALLAHGANPAAPTLQYGKEVPPTPIDVARKKNDADIILWLEDRLHEMNSEKVH